MPLDAETGARVTGNPLMLSMVISIYESRQSGADQKMKSKQLRQPRPASPASPSAPDDGAPAATLDVLYAVAEKAATRYGEIMTAACPDSAVLKLAPLKGRARAAAKAKNEYASKTAPASAQRCPGTPRS